MLVCEYLNYYYKIINDYWAISEKIQLGGFEEIFRFFTLSYGSFGQNKALTLQIPLTGHKQGTFFSKSGQFFAKSGYFFSNFKKGQRKPTL